MKFNIIGVIAKSGTYIFDMQAHYVPRLNEELEINGTIYVVKYVRYQMGIGNFAVQNVKLGLEEK